MSNKYLYCYIGILEKFSNDMHQLNIELEKGNISLVQYYEQRDELEAQYDHKLACANPNGAVCKKK